MPVSETQAVSPTHEERPSRTVTRLVYDANAGHTAFTKRVLSTYPRSHTGEELEIIVPEDDAEMVRLARFFDTVAWNVHIALAPPLWGRSAPEAADAQKRRLARDSSFAKDVIGSPATAGEPSTPSIAEGPSVAEGPSHSPPLSSSPSQSDVSNKHVPKRAKSSIFEAKFDANPQPMKASLVNSTVTSQNLDVESQNIDAESQNIASALSGSCSVHSNSPQTEYARPRASINTLQETAKWSRTYGIVDPLETSGYVFPMEAEIDISADLNVSPERVAELTKAAHCWQFASATYSPDESSVVSFVSFKELIADPGLSPESRISDARSLWISSICRSFYKPSIPYHSYWHCADVAQFTVSSLRRQAGDASLKPGQRLALALSAVGHDVLHPGLTTRSSCEIDTDFKRRYSSLEAYHRDVFKHLSQQIWPEILVEWSGILEDAIDATELAKHHTYIKDSEPPSPSPSRCPTPGPDPGDNSSSGDAESPESTNSVDSADSALSSSTVISSTASTGSVPSTDSQKSSHGHRKRVPSPLSEAFTHVIKVSDFASCARQNELIFYYASASIFTEFMNESRLANLAAPAYAAKICQQTPERQRGAIISAFLDMQVSFLDKLVCPYFRWLYKRDPAFASQHASCHHLLHLMKGFQQANTVPPESSRLLEKNRELPVAT